MLCFIRSSFLVATCLASAAFADFLGPSYPPPVDLTGSGSLVATSWKDLAESLDAILLNAGNSCQTSPLAASIISAGVPNVTFSAGIFSLHDPTAADVLQFHHTSPEVATATNGTRKADGDSIYRVASVTKAFTVLAGLLELTALDWERPLSEVLGPLGEYVSRQRAAGGDEKGVYVTQWDKMTVGSLAAQIGGGPRDGFPNPGELLLQSITDNLTEAELMAKSGLPPYNASDALSNPPCLELLLKGEECSATAYLEGVANRAPAFSPWSHPAYSDNGFTLLGLAISNITGRSIEETYRERIFAPLGMTSSNSTAPPPSDWHRCVIVGDPIQGFAAANGVFVSSGGLFSTIRDLARFGVGVLNSTLLAPERTRRWLKPVSHTPRLQYDVGAPWEIVRYVQPSGKVTDLYTKTGDSGFYSGLLVLIPEYDAGFSILAGSVSSRVPALTAVADAIVEKVIPALAAQAAVEAARKLAGKYRASPASGLNSSLVLSVNQSELAPPGLVISSWISNGTDVLPWLAKLAGPPPLRLVPTISDAAAGTEGQVAFRLVSGLDVPSKEAPKDGLFSGPGFLGADWISVDVSTYSGVGLSLFVFDLGSDGTANAVTPAAYRVTLMRSA